jgi:predicted ATPase
VRVEIRPYNFGVGGVVGVADLRREGVSEEITLGGLSEHEVGELIDATSNLELRPGFVHSVRRETDGNPFFVQEICSHVGETGEPAGAFTLEALGVPEGVKQVIGRRIARLPEGTERLLTIAAVIGRGFDLDLLVDVAGDDEDDVLTRSSGRARPGSSTRTRAPSVAIRSCTPSPGTRSTTRSASPRRARLHRRVAEAIESRYADDLKDHFGALAFHYSAAGTDLPKAVEYSGRAGEQALARLAHEDAAKQFERGLALLAEQDRAAATCSCRRA